MESKDYFAKMKNLVENLLTFLQSEDDLENDFQQLKLFIDKEKINEKDHGFVEFLHLISEISNNHHRTPNFLSRIEKILLSYKDDIKQNFSNYNLYTIFKSNIKLLLFLFEEKFIIFDNSILCSIKSNNLQNFFMLEICSFLKSDNQQNLTFPESFLKNRKEGENHHKICQLIRNDSIDEFIIYVNQNDINLKGKINQSIFETNPFLIANDTTLIEYAAFFGSHRIFNYLQMKLKEMDVSISSRLKLYAIHSNDAEMISNLVQVDENLNVVDLECLFESIKCFHNDICKWIISEKPELQNEIAKNNGTIISYYNFEYIEFNSLQNQSYDSFASYDYYSFTKLFINKIDSIQSMYIERLLVRKSFNETAILLSKYYTPSILSYYFFF